MGRRRKPPARSQLPTAPGKKTLRAEQRRLAALARERPAREAAEQAERERQARLEALKAEPDEERLMLCEVRPSEARRHLFELLLLTHALGAR